VIGIDTFEPNFPYRDEAMPAIYQPTQFWSLAPLEGYITKKGDIRPARSKIEAVGQGGAPGFTGGAGQGSLGRCSQAARRPGQPCLRGGDQRLMETFGHTPACAGTPVPETPLA